MILAIRIWLQLNTPNCARWEILTTRGNHGNIFLAMEPLWITAISPTSARPWLSSFVPMNEEMYSITYSTCILKDMNMHSTTISISCCMSQHFSFPHQNRVLDNRLLYFQWARDSTYKDGLAYIRCYQLWYKITSVTQWRGNASERPNCCGNSGVIILR